jgi:hypothetical protein
MKCPSCGSETVSTLGTCRRCGAALPDDVAHSGLPTGLLISPQPPATGSSAGLLGLPDLELDVPKAAPKAPPKKKEAQEEVAIELAVDLGYGGPPPRASSPSFPAPPTLASGGMSAAPPAFARTEFASPVSAQFGRGALAVPAAHAAGALAADVDMEASTLADYGEAPTSWWMAPLYAYRVFKRQGELKKVLEGRREDAARAGAASEDAHVAFAERARPLAEKAALYRQLVDALRSAEDLLRSRDAQLAAEQDAHAERVASVEARLATLETELAAAHEEERTSTGEVAGIQAAVGREEAKLKRAEAELKAVQTALRASQGSFG